MLGKYFKNRISFLMLPALLFFGAAFIEAQTTEFTYQGKLNDGANAANGNYDFEFRLFSVDTGGTAIGTVQRLNVPVTSGTFAVKLDFGAQFPGANRYLEIAVKPAGGGSFTTLNPRQQISSAPYNVRSLSAANADAAVNASQLGGVAASQYVLTTDARMTDSRNPLAGSSNYIQNTNSAQTANFNISGTGTANILNAATQFNLGGIRTLLSAPAQGNLFVGRLTGAVNTSGINNTFVGTDVGKSNTTGDGNAFFGNVAGTANTTGGNNSFFGANAGFSNTTGGSNAFFGEAAGYSNTTGVLNAFFGVQAGVFNTASSNSFFGASSGSSNTTGTGNSFFGRNSGANNTTANNNSFFGMDAGGFNTTGANNAFFGYTSGHNNTTGNLNAFFGYSAGAANSTASGNSFFGANAGTVNTTGINNSFFGVNAGAATNTSNGNAFFGAASGSTNTAAFNSFFGAFAGTDNTTGAQNAFFGNSTGNNNTTGSNNTFVGTTSGQINTTGSNNTLLGQGANLGSNNLTFATAIGSGAVVSTGSTIVLGRSDGSDTVQVPGKLQIDTLGTAGATALCLNGSNRIGTCSSSLRYKTNVQTFSGGLEIVRRLRPITFNWIDGGMNDLGFAAEEVNRIEPLLTIFNKEGQIEGVKYGQVTTVLVNAVKEQQTEIEQLKEQIKLQQQQIETLKMLVCAINADAAICREK